MSHMKNHIMQHEDGDCSRDPETCLVCKKIQEDGPDLGEYGGTCQDEDSRFAPLIDPEKLQAELQARLNRLMPPDAERDEFENARARNDAAWELSKDGALEAFAVENPKGYECLMTVIRLHLFEALGQTNDEDEARQDYQNGELGR